MQISPLHLKMLRKLFLLLRGEKKASGEVVRERKKRKSLWIKGKEKSDLGRQVERGHDQNIHTDGKLCLWGGLGPGIDLRRSPYYTCDVALKAASAPEKGWPELFLYCYLMKRRWDWCEQIHNIQHNMDSARPFFPLSHLLYFLLLFTFPFKKEM